MQLKKMMFGVFLCMPISSFCMMLGMHGARMSIMLDEQELDEFIQNKRKIVEIGKTLPDFESNKLCAAYKEYMQEEADVLVKLTDDSLQGKINELWDFAVNHEEYKASLKKATSTMLDDEWKAFRYKNGSLMKAVLVTKGFVEADPKDKTRGCLLANKDIKPEAAEYVIASSFLLYLARGMQRKATGKDLPPIEIS